jgi:hypothetical protein
LETPATVVAAKAVGRQLQQQPMTKTTMQAGHRIIINDCYWRNTDNHGAGGNC